jgi:hypothetical protein
MSDAEYRERYCAFVDILGFRDLIARLRSGAVSVANVRNVLSSMHSPPKGRKEAFGDNDFRVQSISDSVVVSAAMAPEGLSQILFSLENLAHGLLLDGYFVRGAIVRGRLFHDDKMVFGEGLVEAYRLESEIVRYPRIMITRQVVEDAVLHHTWSSGFKRYFKQADDGPTYLHVLRSMERELGEAFRKDPEADASESEELDYWVQIRDNIEERFREAVDNPEHFEKVQWFVRYFNNCLPGRVVGLPEIVGPGVEASFF